MVSYLIFAAKIRIIRPDQIFVNNFCIKASLYIFAVPKKRGVF